MMTPGVGWINSRENGPTSTRDQNFLTAESFFSQIMKTANVHISWPTRLKIGAKTKKDPYVKISGHPEQVKVAKEQILAVLRAKQNRVTLKIDVEHIGHSHVIGRGGKNTQRVMQGIILKLYDTFSQVNSGHDDRQETGCHIHFPDSNKNSDFDKSNQVSIAGPLKGVETARAIIRQLSPLSVNFDLKNVRKDVDVAKLMSHPALEFATGTTDITVIIRPNSSSGQPYVILRGSVNQEASIREAMKSLTEKLFSPKYEIPCSIALEILPPQQEVVLGPGAVNMNAISNLTGAILHHPPIHNDKGLSTFHMRGSLDAILNARKQLIGFTPVALSFELSSAPTCDIAALELELNVSVSVKPKRGSDTVKDETTVCNEYDFMRKYHNPAHQIIQKSPINGFYHPALRVSPIQPIATLAVTTAGPNTLGVPVILSPSPIPHPATMLPAPNVSPMEGAAVAVCVSSSENLQQPEQTTTQQAASGSSPVSKTETQTPKRSLSSCGIPRQLSASEDTDSSEPGVDSPIAKALLDSAKGSGNWSRAIGAERKEKLDMARDNMAVLAHEARNQPVLGYRTPNGFFCGYGYSRSMNQPKLSFATSGPSLASHLPAVDEVFEQDEARDQVGPIPNHLAGNNHYRHRRFDLSTFERLPDVQRAVVDSEEYSSLASLLARNGLGRFIPNFEEQQIDYNIFCTLTPDDLADLEINTYVARKKILELIKVCKSSATASR